MKLANIVTIRYIPGWIILLMDIFHTFLSLIISYLLRFNFNVEEARANFFVGNFLIIIGIYIIGFICLKSHKQIIRHSTFHSISKILLAVVAVNLVIILLNKLNYIFNHTQLIPYSVLVISAFVSFCQLAASRIIIRKMFEAVSNMKKEPIIIFGAGKMGLAAAKTISNNRVANWKVIAFIDDDPKKISKTLEDIPIYGMKMINRLIKRYPVTKVIIATSNISAERKNEVASYFIDLGIKVSIPFSQQAPDDLFNIHRLRDLKIEDLLERDPININTQKIDAKIKGKCVLITGAAGSIGSEIVRQVAKFQPGILILVDAAESPLHGIGLELDELKEVNYKLVISNVCNEKRMDNIFKNFQPDVVFHTAAYKHVPMMEDHPMEAILNNILGAKILADLSVSYNVGRFIFISTDKAVNPTNVMGASKRIAEMYIQSLNQFLSGSVNNDNKFRKPTSFITTRFGNVLASNGSVVHTFKAQIDKGGPVTVTHPEITRFFMTIPEAAELVLEAAIMGKGGEIFVFDMGKSVRILDLAIKMITMAGYKPEVDIKIVYTALRPGEKLYEEVLSDLEHNLPTYHPKIKLAKAKHNSYYSLNESINELIEAAKQELDWECVKIMKKIVPEFISNNSKYGCLDNVQNTEQSKKEVFLGVNSN
ncbi:MAG: nucleoside-diphosphate sugar epimerase/dehydratase [Ferruginibacter sp.]